MKDWLFGKCFRLADAIDVQPGQVAVRDIVNRDGTRFALMAFDEGARLSPHRAPGDAIVFALEGEAIIGYEGADFVLREGEQFAFAKGALHDVRPKGRFIMAILLTGIPVDPSTRRTPYA